MLERDVEKYLVAQVKKLGGEIRKVKWIGRRGCPDRVVFFRGAHFVELKRPGGVPRREQLREHERMLRHGVTVHVLDSYESVNAFCRSL